MGNSSPIIEADHREDESAQGSEVKPAERPNILAWSEKERPRADESEVDGDSDEHESQSHASQRGQIASQVSIEDMSHASQQSGRSPHEGGQADEQPTPTEVGEPNREIADRYSGLTPQQAFTHSLALGATETSATKGGDRQFTMPDREVEALFDRFVSRH